MCNVVNSDEISEDGDLTHRGFHEYASYGKSGAPAMVCSECEGEVDGVRQDYRFEDDEFGWTDEFEEEE